MTTPIGSSDGEREAFEAWFKVHAKKVHLERVGDTYFGDWAACAWEGWQARAALGECATEQISREQEKRYSTELEKSYMPALPQPIAEQMFEYARAKALAPRLIRTSHAYPPIPERSMDWTAVFADSYEPGDHIGYGPNEAAAIADLLLVSEYEGPISLAKKERACMGQHDRIACSLTNGRGDKCTCDAFDPPSDVPAGSVWDAKNRVWVHPSMLQDGVILKVGTPCGCRLGECESKPEPLTCRMADEIKRGDL